MKYNQHDADILRRLAERKLQYAEMSENRNNIALWRAVNDLKMHRPPVYINEIPWHEMNVNGELDLHCEDEGLRAVEDSLRKELYCRAHMPVNMVVSPAIESYVSINDSGFGLMESTDIVRTDTASDVVSRRFYIQIQDDSDIEKIRDPIISVDETATEQRFEALSHVFRGILPVTITGVKGYWFTPWDNLVRLTGIQEMMMDLVERPEYINRLVTRFVDASMVRLQRYTELGLWGSNNNNTRVGSGGYGYTSDLPSGQDDLIGLQPSRIWGCGNAQIFSEVSPAMHWEFSLKHELRWISAFGLSYYGCCEPLHRKIGILERIPNLRKISMSPWADLDHAANAAGQRYVLSCKPNPAIFLDANWNPDRVRADIRNILRQTEGCNIEIILKDISTVAYQPQRLWQWADLAMETIDRVYG